MKAEEIAQQIAAASALHEQLGAMEAGSASQQDLLHFHLQTGDFESALSCVSKLRTLENPSTLAGELASLLGASAQAADEGGIPSIDHGDPGERLKAARRLLESRRLKEAFSRLDSLLLRYPSYTEALVLQTELSASLRNWEMAEDFMRRVPPRDRCRPDVVQTWAKLLFRKREFAAAEVCFCFLEERGALPDELAILRAIGEAPSGFAAKLAHVPNGLLPVMAGWLRSEVISGQSLDRLEFDQREWEFVIRVAVAAYAPPRVLGKLLAAANPHDFQALVQTTEGKGWLIPNQALKAAGELCRKAKNNRAAIQIYRLLPDDSEAQEKLLRLEFAACEEDPFRSRASLNSLLKICLDRQKKRHLRDPRDYGSSLAYARSLRMAERFSEALPVLEGLTQEQPAKPAAMRELVHIAQALRDTESAAGWSDRVLELCPSDESAAIVARRTRRIQSGGESAAFSKPAGDSLGLILEYLRDLFSRGDFGDAKLAGEQALLRFPSDARLHLLVAAACLELGELDKAQGQIELAAHSAGLPRVSSELPLFEFALHQKRSGVTNSLHYLNSYFAAIDASPLALQQNCGKVVFDRFLAAGQNLATPDGPLVSVIMTSFHVENYVETAVRSILQQSYRNLELIVVDDASTDGTVESLRQIRDARLKILVNEVNAGTYVSKNRALAVARGDYIAFQDSDDWSHPDRIKRSVSVLEQHPHFDALRTQWMRMTNEGETVIRPRGNIADNCCISLFMRRTVLSRIGFFDSVRADADVELVHRLRLAVGPSAFPDLPWMLMFGRVRDGALTSTGAFGLTRGGFNPLRQKYRESYRAFHRAIVAGGSPYLDFPLLERKFEAPPDLLP